MPVWIEPKGSRTVKLRAFVVYLRAMRDRNRYIVSESPDEITAERPQARADVYDLVATQLETLL